MGVKTVFNKTGNRFVKTGYLPLVRLCNVMCHMAARHRKTAGGWKAAG